MMILTRSKRFAEPSLGRTLRLFATGLIFGGLLVWTFLAQPYRLIINYTASEPEGLYLLHWLGADALRRGELVSFRYEAPWPILPYTTYPNGAGFLKRIAGVPGDRVQSKGGHYVLTTPDGDTQSLGTALTQTPSGVPVPYRAHYRGATIPVGRYYMAGDGNPDSYDSRYYGLISRSRIIGIDKLLWAW